MCITYDIHELLRLRLFLHLERMKNFYSAAFGWHMQQLGPEMGDYVVAQTYNVDGGQWMS